MAVATRTGAPFEVEVDFDMESWPDTPALELEYYDGDRVLAVRPLFGRLPKGSRERVVCHSTLYARGLPRRWRLCPVLTGARVLRDGEPWSNVMRLDKPIALHPQDRVEVNVILVGRR